MFTANQFYSHSIKADGDNIQVFSLAGLGLEGGGQLTRGSLILIALLAGGDYDEVRYRAHYKAYADIVCWIDWGPRLWCINCRLCLHVWSR